MCFSEASTFMTWLWYTLENILVLTLQCMNIHVHKTTWLGVMCPLPRPCLHIFLEQDRIAWRTYTNTTFEVVASSSGLRIQCRSSVTYTSLSCSLKLLSLLHQDLICTHDTRAAYWSRCTCSMLYTIHMHHVVHDTRAGCCTRYTCIMLYTIHVQHVGRGKTNLCLKCVCFELVCRHRLCAGNAITADWRSDWRRDAQWKVQIAAIWCREARCDDIAWLAALVSWLGLH